MSKMQTAVPSKISMPLLATTSAPASGTVTTTTATAFVNTKRGHIRSSSLENTNSFNSKNTLGLPILSGNSSTLKSRNEQKRIRNKFGSHSNLEDYVPAPRTKFQNIRLMFELSKKSNTKTTKTTKTATGDKSAAVAVAVGDKSELLQEMHVLQSLPITVNNRGTPTSTCTPTPTIVSMTASMSAVSGGAAATVRNANVTNSHPHAQKQQEQQQQHQFVPKQQLLHMTHQQLQQHPHHPHQQLQQTFKPKSKAIMNVIGSGNRNSLAEYNERLGIHDSLTNNKGSLQVQQQQRCNSSEQGTLILRPIAFKPIPFEPDYSIPNRLCDVTTVVDRYASTPSLAPTQGSSLRFGSTTDLRHGVGGVGAGLGAVSGMSGISGMSVSSYTAGVAGITVGGNAATTTAATTAYLNGNYCGNSLLLRRRGSRSLRINDSMESIRRTPDSTDAHIHIHNHTQHGVNKSNCGNNNSSNINNVNNINTAHTHIDNNNNNNNNKNHNNNGSNNNSSSNNSNNNNINNNNNKYIPSVQCDMTPSPSDSGISELEAALKDRDSELSYLRQTMEHNEKDKEHYWEQEHKRLKVHYEAQQQECVLKLQKMEQMYAMQQFQFKQHKLRHTDQCNKLREQMAELKHENETLRSDNGTLKSAERNLKDRLAYVEEQLRKTQHTLDELRAQLEESEWKTCERNGEIALLKTQLKEANVELTMKEHALVHLKHEHTTNTENQIYQSLQEHQEQQQQQQQQQQVLNAAREQETQLELQQLNKIIILKDQVILALTNELAKLRKELSDLVIFQEYGEEPSGKYVRLKQQLDSLNDICAKTTAHTAHTPYRTATANEANFTNNKAPKVIDDNNLELIMNCLKLTPSLDVNSVQLQERERELTQLNAEHCRLAKMTSDIQKFAYGAKPNLPDVAMSVPPLGRSINSGQLEESTLDTLIKESANYAEEIAHLRKQLDDVRVNFELEKRQWCEEREKVLSYQKQLQAHYINMYQKLRNLKGCHELV